MPEFWSILRARTRALLKRRQLDRDLQEEIRFHLSQKQGEFEAAGAPAQEAESLARRRFGNQTSLQESCREAWIFGGLENCARDARYALRVFAKNPVFAVIAVLTLAFGIGATASIFSAIDAVLLRALPYNEPGQLYTIREAVRLGPRRVPLTCVNAGDFLLWPKYSDSFTGMALLMPTTADLNLNNETVQLRGVRASASLFTILGIRPQIGRTFTAAEDRMGGGNAIILTQSLWRERFHSDPGIVGRTILSGGFPATVAGVLPESFYFPKQNELYASSIAGWSHPIEFFVNLGLLDNEIQPGLQMQNFAVIARLRPMSSVKRATAELDAAQAEASKGAPGGAQLQVDLTPLKAAIIGTADQKLWAFMAGAVLVLLLVCINLAGLLIANGAGRMREIGVRTALGASRTDIVRQLVVEALILSVTGGILGLIAAYWGVHVLTQVAPVEIPRLQSIVIDFRVLLFSAAISIGAGILFSLLPALQLSGVSASRTLKIAGPTTTTGHSVSRVHQVLAASEIALSTVLLVSALLIGQSLLRVLKTNNWANVSHVVAIDFNVPANHYQRDAKRAQLYTRLLDVARNYPGVQAVGITSALPFQGEMWNDDVQFKEDAKPETERPNANWRFISPDYFHATGVGLVGGRFLSRSDYGRHLVVISERLAKQLPRGMNPVGVHIFWTPPGSSQKSVLYEVAGVAADARAKPDEAPPSMVYVPYWEWPPWEAALVVRTAGDPRSVGAGMQQLLRRMDRDIAVAHAQSLHDILDEAVAPRRFVTFLGLLFAGSATFLAALGLYGLMSLSASQRTREIGVRIAIGAQGVQIFRMIVSQAVVLAIIGLGCGVGCAWAVARTLSAFLYDVKPSDPPTFVYVCAGLLAVSLIASYLPARRATRVDPVTALKWE